MFPFFYSQSYLNSIFWKAILFIFNMLKLCNISDYIPVACVTLVVRLLSVSMVTEGYTALFS